ncbi:hypothetical protein P5V15_000433 [Pogonomyrmex californicus]
MIEHYRKLIKIVNKQMKSQIFYNKKTIEKNQEKTQGKLIDVQNIAIKKYDIVIKLIGLDTIETNRKQVIDLQNQLFKCQDNRRVHSKELMDITYKLQEKQKKISNQQILLEEEEKDKFIQLATATKEYHDIPIKYSANLLVSGASYIKKGVYACVSYVPFTRK